MLEEGVRHPAPLPEPHPVARGRSSASTNSAATSASSRSSSAIRRSSSRSAIAKTEPGDENNQDISSLVGKVDIRKLETYAQDDPDAYSYSGGLCLANQGLLEFVEMFKAPIKVLHPLLTATQEGNFKGTEGFGAIPFDGIVLAHSQRVASGRPSATTRTTRPSSTGSTSSRCRTACACSEEVKIYEKLLRNSSLAEAMCAPGTLKMMAQFAVLTRLKEPENSSLFSKMQVYDGENLKDTDPKAKSYQEYRDYAGVDEGMSGVSTRFAFKILSQGLQLRLDRSRRQSGAPDVRARAADRARAVPAGNRAEVPVASSRTYLAPRYAEFIGKEIQTAYLESVFASTARTSSIATSPTPTSGFRTRSTAITDTGESLRPRGAERRAGEDREAGGHQQPEGLPQRDRQLRAARARQQRRQEPGVDQLREAARGDREEDVLEHRGAAAGDLLQRQGERPKRQRKHEDFVNRMVAKGYTPKQVRLLCEWYLRVRKSS